MSHLGLDRLIPSWVALFDVRNLLTTDLKIKAACNVFLVAAYFGDNKSNAPHIAARMPEFADIADMFLKFQDD